MPIRINLLAEQQALEEERRRDPVKRAIWIGAFLVALMLIWSMSLLGESMLGKSELSRFQVDRNSRTNEYRQILENKKRLDDIHFKLAALHRLATNRFLVGNLLNALQQGPADEVQLTHLKIDQNYVLVDEIKATTGENPTPAKPATATEKITLSLDAKDNSSDAGAGIGKYQEALSRLPYFLNALGKPLELKLQQRGTPQTDADGRVTVFFRLECRFPDKTR